MAPPPVESDLSEAPARLSVGVKSLGLHVLAPNSSLPSTVRLCRDNVHISFLFRATAPKSIDNIFEGSGGRADR